MTHSYRPLIDIRSSGVGAATTVVVLGFESTLMMARRSAENIVGRQPNAIDAVDRQNLWDL